jgi:hypothetical protein
MLGWLLGGLWLSALGVWLMLHPHLHADALYLLDLLQRLQGGSRLGLWDLPPASSLFPDLGLCWLAQRFRPEPAPCLWLYGLFLGFWLWIVLARLLRQLFDLEQSLSRAFAASGLLLLLLLAPADSGLSDWLLPSHHGTAFVGALSLWAWALRQREQASTWGATAWGAVPAGFLLGSDPFFGLWAGPALVLFSLRLRWPARWRLALGALLSVVVAAAFHWALHLAGARMRMMELEFVRQHAAEGYRQAWPQVRGLLSGAPGLSLALLLGLGLWAWPLESRHSGPRVAILAWALSLALSAFLFGATGFLGGRYLYLLPLPVLLLPALLAERYPHVLAAALLGPALAALLLLLQPGQAAEALEQRQADWLDARLQERGLRWGWADYWRARPLRLLSHAGVVTVPMIETPQGLRPYFWIGDASLFGEGAALERPQYIVTTGLDEAMLRQRLGPPDEVLTGEGLTVWFKTAPVPKPKKKR